MRKTGRASGKVCRMDLSTGWSFVSASPRPGTLRSSIANPLTLPHQRICSTSLLPKSPSRFLNNSPLSSVRLFSRQPEASSQSTEPSSTTTSSSPRATRPYVISTRTLFFISVALLEANSSLWICYDQFDDHIKDLSPHLGLRDVSRFVEPVARQNGFSLVDRLPGPGGNWILIFRPSSACP